MHLSIALVSIYVAFGLAALLLLRAHTYVAWWRLPFILATWPLFFLLILAFRIADALERRHRRKWKV